MVGTLVVTLPSSYAGGELMVGHNEEWKAYRGSKTALSLVAFYADCRHEVLKVTSGYRITLTYNLLLHGNTAVPTATREPSPNWRTCSASTSARRCPAITAEARRSAEPARLPARPRVHAARAELAAAKRRGREPGGSAAGAADKAGCEAVLALADIKTTHSAFSADESYGYQDWYDEYDEDDDEYSGGASGSDGDYDIQELIDSEVSLTHWTGPDGTRLEETSLSVDGDEVCASTETGGLEAYSSEYEGYMGNWGNTLDRWYHRAAVLVWPRDQAFANRAETSRPGPSMSSPRSRQRATCRARGPPWRRSRRSGTGPCASGQRRPAAGSPGSSARRCGPRKLVADAESAAMLLRPFRIENLTDACVNSFGEVADRYGQQWTAELLRAWFGGDQPTWAYGGGQERPQWVADWVPGLCKSLYATGGAGAVAAQRLLDLAWQWIGKDIGSGLALSSPSYRDEKLGGLGKPLASVLTAAAAIGAASTRDEGSRIYPAVGGTR